MPTPAVVRQAFRDQHALAVRIEKDVDRHIEGLPKEWYFTGRVKGEESFSQKVQSGKVRDLARLEDFFACEIVVPLASDIDSAIEFLGRFFVERYRRPASSSATKKSADSFVFDDLRLYGTLKPDPSLPKRPIDDIVFEIQVKTFLQHAWAIATHDLVYKFDRASWARSRVAFQVKALLEQAELAIHGISELEKNDLLPAYGEPESSLQQLIDFANLEFDEAVLPRDRRRMAMTLLATARRFGYIAFDDLARLFRSGKRIYSGHPQGWSPYDCLVDYASRRTPARVRKALMSPKDKGKIFITREVLKRMGIALDQLPNAIL